MNTQELIARIEALGKALSDATNEAIIYVVVQPYFTDEMTAAELFALADHYGSEVKTVAGSFAIDIKVGGVKISARTKYGAADNYPSPKELLREAAMKVPETPATA